MEIINDVEVYNIYDFPIDIKTNRKNKYSDSFATFDIETSSVRDINGDYGFMYHWQMCIDGKVLFGRTFEELQYFMNKLSEKIENKMVIYVHNLSFEFQFIKNFFDFEKVFATDSRSILFAVTNKFEFRCSYRLTNMSLYQLTKNTVECKHKKQKNDLDYTIIRYPWTELTKEEKYYCVCDVLGLYECILQRLNDDALYTIPYTSTGYIRRNARKIIFSNPDNKKLINKTRLTPELYLLCKEQFKGGEVHSNPKNTDKNVENVYSFDETSAYIAVMLMDYFPVTKFKKLKVPDKKYINNYCNIMIIELFNIHCNFPIPYIPVAKVLNFSNISACDNGRVVTADYIRMVVNEIDYNIIVNTYLYDIINIEKQFISERGELCEEHKTYLRDLFRYKNTLKGVIGKEYLYMKRKEELNGNYGMMVTDITNPDYLYDSNTHTITKKEKDLAESLESYYNNRNSFLIYQQGIYVPSHARRRLWNALLLIDNPWENIVYCDTDSIKFTGEQNIKIFEKLNEENKKNAIKKKAYAISDDGNKQWILGEWEYEGKYDYFKTLGAKKYCYVKDGKFGITVSGMSKDVPERTYKGKSELSCLNDFYIGKEVHNSGRTTSYFNDVEKPYKIKVGDREFTTGSNIAVFNTTYTIGITNEYLDFITDIKHQ